MGDTNYQDLLNKYVHNPEEFPVLRKQTHKIIRDGKMVSEEININENIIHYIQDTALLISIIDGTISNRWTVSASEGEGVPFDHVVYLDKSARPVSWLVNMFWDDFASKDKCGNTIKRPSHSYVNIDRSPWFRNVGINVSDDGRQKENGELATYGDFINHIDNLTQRHLAEIRALYIEGGIDEEDEEKINRQPSILDGKRILIIDEVSRTGATLNIAKCLFKRAFPKAECVEGAYFWNPSEAPLMVGNEEVMTSLPVWYDPHSLTGRGIGGLDSEYYQKRYSYYLSEYEKGKNISIKKIATQRYSSGVYSAPLLKKDGNVLDLKDEKKTRLLFHDLRTLYDEYHKGTIFFDPPIAWSDIDYERFESVLIKQGVIMMPWDATDDERVKIRKNPLFYLNFKTSLKTYMNN